ncbi:hypothetical protein ACFV1L_24280 [Kitasatospora sp. NPDC059646]|uniref:hypothetical protein n=1 Tax=Kitasatospora sp. NPDC059646 TaxID=3346893 RepID=UPI0036925E84
MIRDGAAAGVEGAPVAEVVRTGLHTDGKRIRQRPDDHLPTYELTRYALRRAGLEGLTPTRLIDRGDEPAHCPAPIARPAASWGPSSNPRRSPAARA